MKKLNDPLSILFFLDAQRIFLKSNGFWYWLSSINFTKCLVTHLKMCNFKVFLIYPFLAFLLFHCLCFLPQRYILYVLVSSFSVFCIYYFLLFPHFFQVLKILPFYTCIFLKELSFTFIYSHVTCSSLYFETFYSSTF